MSKAKHIAEFKEGHMVSMDSSVQYQLTTEDIMKDICIDKNWIEGVMLDGHLPNQPTTHINIYSDGETRVVETRVDSRHLGGDQVITYEVTA